MTPQPWTKLAKWYFDWDAPSDVSRKAAELMGWFYLLLAAEAGELE